MIDFNRIGKRVHRVSSGSCLAACSGRSFVAEYRQDTVGNRGAAGEVRSRQIAAVNRKRTLVVNTGNRKAAGFDCELAIGFNRHFAGNRAGLFSCFITERQAVCALNRNRLDASAEKDTVVAGKCNDSRFAIDRNGFSISLDIGDKNRSGRCQTNSFICCSGRNGRSGTLKTARSHIGELQIFTGCIGSDDGVEHRQLVHCRGNLVVFGKRKRTICRFVNVARIFVENRTEGRDCSCTDLAISRRQSHNVVNIGIDSAVIDEYIILHVSYSKTLRSRNVTGYDNGAVVRNAGCVFVVNR